MDKNFTQTYNADKFSLKNLTVSISEDMEYDNSVLYQVNVVFQPGKFYRLSGESGSGKTTVLKAIMNCWPFVSGEVNYPTTSENICFIPQQICIPPQLTLLEIIAYPMIIKDFLRNIFHANEKVMNLMMEMNLSKYIDRLNYKDLNWSFILSGGEKQKIAIIGAVVKAPSY